MARPRAEHPTPAELEILKLLWERGEMSVREVLEATGDKPRAYTSVMSLLNVMTEKGLLSRRPDGRAFLYLAKAKRESTAGSMLGDVLGRVFEGSAHALVARLLEESRPDHEELDRIHDLIESYRSTEGDAEESAAPSIGATSGASIQGESRARLAREGKSARPRGNSNRGGGHGHR
jgi:BlaI family penicillinase repressor